MFSVSQLNEQAKTLLEATFCDIEVSGEISSFTHQRASGHWYFVIKDEKASISAAMFKFANQKIKFTPEVGMKVILGGKVSIYPASGNYQFIASTMRHEGAGDLEIAFNQLKSKLEKEGLFETSRKKPLPNFPRKIALLTSLTSAAYQDMLRVARERYELCKIDSYGVFVQGENTAPSIINALKIADKKGYDAIVIARGGGSKEDLWHFNDEFLARAIFAANTPIISAVGHEIDYSISDFVADERSLTPTAAMVDLLPDKNTLYQDIDLKMALIKEKLEFKLRALDENLRYLNLKLKTKSVGEKLKNLDMNLSNLNFKMSTIMNQKFTNLDHFLSLKGEILNQKAKFFELTKDMVSLNLGGKRVVLEELKSGDEITLSSQTTQKTAKIL